MVTDIPFAGSSVLAFRKTPNLIVKTPTVERAADNLLLKIL